jgi:hypothetical protein
MKKEAAYSAVSGNHTDPFAAKSGTKTRFIVPEKLYRIGDIVRCTPFTRQTIHNYTTMGLIQESGWTDGGHRLYDESVFEQLSRILELRKTRTLAEIRRIFQEERNAKAS